MYDSSFMPPPHVISTVHVRNNVSLEAVCSISVLRQLGGCGDVSLQLKDSQQRKESLTDPVSHSRVVVCAYVIVVEELGEGLLRKGGALTLGPLRRTINKL